MLICSCFVCLRSRLFYILFAAEVYVEDVNVFKCLILCLYFFYFLQRNSFLARRLLNQELEPLTIVNMSPDELKVWSLSCFGI